MKTVWHTGLKEVVCRDSYGTIYGLEWYNRQVRRSRQDEIF